ncbi:hypothetical protein [Geodermatophilus sp. CPCC 206100]|uniref:hypothetical protein n=1 Tax=Geodermatophilus sp. CPCC 206100 TaxID=3020054 RepID=UPI003AFFD9ED
MASRSGTLWRLTLGIGDSALPSVGNLGISVVAAHSMTIPGFGAFTTILLLLILAVGLSRAAHGDVLVLRAAESPDVRARDRRDSTTSVLVLGACVGVLTMLCGLALRQSGGDGDWVAVVVAGGAVLPVVLLQDHYRWIAYAQGRIADSLLNNLCWVATGIAGMLVVLQAQDGPMGAHVGVLVWGLAAVPAVVVGACRAHCPPRPGRPGRWLSDNRRLAFALVQDFGLLQASAQGALVLLAALTSTTDLAYLRKAQIWMGPVTMVTTGLLSTLQSLLARRHGGKPVDVARLAGTIAAVATVGALLYGSAVFLLPANWAGLLAGEGWEQARPFVWPLAVQLAGGIAGGCLGIALRVLGEVQRQVRFRYLIAPLSLALVAVAAGVSGALAAVWALAAISVATAVLWLLLLARVVGTSLRGGARSPRESTLERS